MDYKVDVHFANSVQVVSMSPDKTILQSLKENKIPIHHACGGNGTCGTCKIFVLSGQEQLASPGEIEKEMIEDREFSIHERLSCQIFLNAKVTSKNAALAIKIPNINE